MIARGGEDRLRPVLPGPGTPSRLCKLRQGALIPRQPGFRLTQRLLDELERFHRHLQPSAVVPVHRLRELLELGTEIRGLLLQIRSGGDPA